MNMIQMKLNVIINDIQKIAVEIENLKKRVSDLEIILLDCNIPMGTKKGNNDNEQD